MSFEGTPQPIADLTVRRLQYYVGHNSAGLAGKELAPVSGTNANGTYAQYADGTMICTYVDATGLACATASGSLFTAAAAGTWTFPAAFISATGVAVAGSSATSARWVTCGALTASNVTYTNFAASSSATVTALRLIAIGRWF